MEPTKLALQLQVPDPRSQVPLPLQLSGHSRSLHAEPEKPASHEQTPPAPQAPLPLQPLGQASPVEAAHRLLAAGHRILFWKPATATSPPVRGQDTQPEEDPAMRTRSVPSEVQSDSKHLVAKSFGLLFT